MIVTYLLMSQTRLGSFIESCVQTAVAFSLSTLIQPHVLQHYSCTLSYQMSMEIALIFTLVSFVRGYVVRRVANAYPVIRGKVASWVKTL